MLLKVLAHRPAEMRAVEEEEAVRPASLMRLVAVEVVKKVVEVEVEVKKPLLKLEAPQLLHLLRPQQQHLVHRHDPSS